MKYIPMLFSTPMVQQLLAGNKTMTRRVVKPELSFRENSGFNYKGAAYGIGASSRETMMNFTRCVHPYGEAGDVIWVRETWFSTRFNSKDLLDIGITDHLRFKADDNYDPVKDCVGRSWNPSIHMPKSAARIFLKITDVRVERLNEISESDSIAEGIPPDPEGGFKSFETISEGKHRGKSHPHSALPNRSAKTSFTELWKTINGKDSWDANPWVWVVEFERIEKPNDFI